MDATSTHPSELEQDPQAQEQDPQAQEQDPQAQREATGLVDEQVPQSEEDSISKLLLTARDDLDGILGEEIRERNKKYQKSHNEEKEELPLEGEEELQMDLQKSALQLLPYLLHKYWISKPVSEKDILSQITVGHQHYFPVILDKANLFMQVLYGLEMKEEDSILHTRVLGPAAGITYDGVVSDVIGMPKTGLLIMVLCTIYIKGGCALEQDIWHVLNKMEVYSDREHFLYGKPRNLLMGDFVWEQYVIYEKVPDSNPAVYEFMWGTRAYAETTKMKLLQHWAKYCRVDPRSLGSLYAETLQQQRGRYVFH
ncbi:melanoma-associated antigen 10-like [Perognathus longimembris pacificus]|uniref:melanoma-associated antigen 10-like n=1 Tax=Perognathus longimembris pacificus TaxID=214514 RepID=UPI002018A6B8|nr:melanoma-associated antigen 10-like [Perognathus longimembris pacificus]XP_048191418.1 melanoma-associated antigen 10-like [Perognathus longimembris pacificus]